MAANDRPGSTDVREENASRPAAPSTPAPTAGRPSVPAAELVPLPAGDTADRKAAKASKKEKKLLKDAHRPLDSWERYRALTDVLDEAIDLVDLADHKARFALVIMGALNALLFIMASQTDVFDFIPSEWRLGAALFAIAYALVALYFVIQAIESLRPRKAQPQVRYAAETGLEDFPVGLRFYEDILSRDVEAYRRAWRELRIGQLNAELAVQAHAMAQINKAKYSALRRLYLGLQLMTVMAVVLAAVGSYFVLAGKARRGGLGAALGKGKKAQAGWGAVQEFRTPGVREPSGLAFDPRSGHLFLVGDEGTVAELDGAGQVLGTTPLPGNLEDVTVQSTTGDLVILAEQQRELILFDPAGRRERRRWQLDAPALLGQPPAGRNQGFEGLAFRAQSGRPGGGVFYLSHQRAPAMLVAIAFDTSRASGALGNDVVVARWPVSGFQDLTAVTYAAPLDRLLVIADAQDQLLVMRMDGTVEREVPLPGKQQEGIALDAQGNLWVADDRAKSVLRIEGGLDRLRDQVGG